MKGKYSISKLERILILSFTFVALALFAAGIFGEALQSYNYTVVEHQKELARKADVNIMSFSGGGPLFTIPLFHLILSFIFLFDKSTKVHHLRLLDGSLPRITLIECLATIGWRRTIWKYRRIHRPLVGTVDENRPYRLPCCRCDRNPASLARFNILANLPKRSRST